MEPFPELTRRFIKDRISALGSVPSQLLNVLVSIILLVIFVYLIMWLFDKTLKGIWSTAIVPPGIIELPSFPVVGILPYLIWNVNDLPNYFNIWASKYGPVGRTSVFGKSVVILNDPNMIQKMFSSNDTGHVVKPEYLYETTFTDFLANGLVSSKPIIWKRHRSVLSKAFTYEAIKSYFHIFNRHSHKLVSELGIGLASQMKENVFLKNLHRSTFEIISDIVTGPNVMSSAECLTFYKNFHRCQEIVAERLLRPWLLWNPIWTIHPLNKELYSCINNIEICIRKLLKRKREELSIIYEDEPMKSLMDVMMSAELTDEEILIEMTTFLIAGHDTVSVSLHFLMISLAMNPKHQAACQEEVDKMFQDLSMNEESSLSDITMDNISELKYLERCIKESLRMYPSIPILARELETPIKLTDEMELGEGATVVISPWMIHRNANYYSEPDKFDPDRFLPEQCRSRHPYAYIPFSGGPRNCIGWKMALNEVKIVAAYIIRHFEIYTDEAPSDIKLRFNISLALEKDVKLILKERHHA